MVKQPVSAGGAFFDLDGTLTDKSVGRILISKALAMGLLSRSDVLKATTSIGLSLVRGSMDSGELSERLYREFDSVEVEVFEQLARAAALEVAANLRGFVASEFAKHKDEGRKVFIVSSAPDTLVSDLISVLGIDGGSGTKLESVKGALTGRTVDGALTGARKADTLIAIAHRLGLDLQHCFAYGDSAADIPMLEAVGHPVVVAPDSELRRVATESAWPIVD